MIENSRLSIDKFKILDNRGIQDFECGHLGFFARTSVNPGSWVKVELEIVWKTNSSVSPSKLSHFTVDRCIRYFEIRFILNFAIIMMDIFHDEKSKILKIQDFKISKYRYTVENGKSLRPPNNCRKKHSSRPLLSLTNRFLW